MSRFRAKPARIPAACGSPRRCRTKYSMRSGRRAAARRIAVCSAGPTATSRVAGPMSNRRRGSMPVRSIDRYADRQVADIEGLAGRLVVRRQVGVTSGRSSGRVRRVTTRPSIDRPREADDRLRTRVRRAATTAPDRCRSILRRTVSFDTRGATRPDAGDARSAPSGSTGAAAAHDRAMLVRPSFEPSTLPGVYFAATERPLRDVGDPHVSF